MRKPYRFFVPSALMSGAIIAAPDDVAHHARHVLRLADEASAIIFNGTDGEWMTQFCWQGKRGGEFKIQSQLRTQHTSPDIWLAFSPIKHAAQDDMIEKATELGVTRFIPVRTQRCVVTRIADSRLRARMISAAQQCERLDIPTLDELTEWDHFLAHWPATRTLYYADESGASGTADEVFGQPGANPAALLIGPEGGFSEAEHRLLQQQSFARGISMGPRIFRADTAAIVGLTLLMSRFGDWHIRPQFTSSHPDQRFA